MSKVLSTRIGSKSTGLGQKSKTTSGLLKTTSTGQSVKTVAGSVAASALLLASKPSGYRASFETRPAELPLSTKVERIMRDLQAEGKIQTFRVLGILDDTLTVKIKVREEHYDFAHRRVIRQAVQHLLEPGKPYIELTFDIEE